MAKKTINLGSTANAGNGDPLRVAFEKINNNFDELYDVNQTLKLIDGGSASTVFDNNSEEGSE